MKKFSILLFIFCFVVGTASIALADNYDNDDNSEYYKPYYSDNDYKYWRDHGNYDRWRDRRYKIWHYKCEKYIAFDCSYSHWSSNENWSDRQWRKYWECYSYDRIHKKTDALNNLIYSARSLFIW